ncbi:MAG TPA: hypothetical protein VIL42_02575 [Sphingomicrobium sp.]|jgi:hypothetical protein
MKGGRARALVILLLLVLGGIAVAAALANRGTDERAQRLTAKERPKLLLLTSLPLLFGEGFSLEESGSPALKALEARYRIVPISTASAPELAKGKLLLMAHPLGQAPEDLVALDEWVRAGGRLLLLADPMLEWPSERPLGDALRPPAMFVDTGLLGHWGLRLDAPTERGPRALQLGGVEVLTGSPGRLSGKCQVSTDRLVARCAVGKGKATIVADADFLNVEDLDGPTQHNLDGLIAELAAVER